MPAKKTFWKGKTRNSAFGIVFLFFYCFQNFLPTQGQLTHDKILDEIKWKAFLDDKLNNKTDISVFDKIENIVGKGENAGYQHFLFPSMFSKGLFLRGVKRCHCVGMG